VAETILVTGGAGFIGSHVVDTLLEAGYSVAVVDDLHTGKRENVNPAARFHLVDIRAAEALEQVFAAERPAYVVHEAAWADVRGSLADPAGYAGVNVLGTLNLLEAARRSGGSRDPVRKIVFASTGGAIYGDPAELPATEACPPAPLDAYGASKLAAEGYFGVYRHNYGLDFCILRYGNVYGPRQDPLGEAGVVAIFTGQMLRGGTSGGSIPLVNGDGRQSRDFVYVGDVARANLLALTAGSGIYNVGTGDPDGRQLHLARAGRADGLRRAAAARAGQGRRGAGHLPGCWPRAARAGLDGRGVAGRGAGAHGGVFPGADVLEWLAD